VPKNLPVYSLDAFKKSLDRNELYCNSLNPHVKEHKFTNLPHKHDFYLIVIITKGKGWHEIDFVRYNVSSGSVFMMRPGQMHYWKLSDNIQGYVFFHTKDFYDQGYTLTGIEDYAFFKSFRSHPSIKVSSQKLQKLSLWMNEILIEYKKPNKFAYEKIHALINLVYIDLSEYYIKIEKNQKQTYLSKLTEFERLIEKHYRETKLVSEYALKLNISEKHLNRITRTCLNKTATQLIADRIILEAKRLLIQAKINVSHVAYDLGFTDISYFIRMFKKQTGETPLKFLKNQINKNY